VPWRNSKTSEAGPWKLFLWVALAGLIFGLIGFGEIAEDLLRAGRNSLHWHKASGNIVLVKIDDPSLREIGRWPWARRYQAELTDKLTSAGSRRIFFDLSFDSPTNPTDDRIFAESLQRSGRAVLAVNAIGGPAAGSSQESLPLPMFAAHSRLGAISVTYNYLNTTWSVPYSVPLDGKLIPTFATVLADKPTRVGNFIPDYSTDPASIPTVSAADVVKGRFDPKQLAGKDVIIGWTTDVLGDQYYLPGTGKMGGAYLHIIAGETLRSGNPVSLGWIPLYLLSLGVVLLVVRRRHGAGGAVMLGAAAFVTLLAPAALEAKLIFVDVTPALFVLLTACTVLTSRHVKQRGLVNEMSGLPNLNALRGNRAGRHQAIIAARVLNYEEITATLPATSERQLVDQIVSRLRIAAPERTLYQGDAGIFAWFEDPRQPLGNHLEALHSLFRNPARVAGLPIDLSVAFGVEIGSSRSLANRLASALVAADESARDGLKWKYHDPESLEDASWKLSMLSQLDEAIDKGEVWVAFQPKLDLASRRIVGAEALARWTHPEKGPIAASEFVAAAEQHNRIGKLTDFVLEKAVAGAAVLNKRGVNFGIAVNLSARLLTDKGFTLRLAALLARHGLPPHQLTLELTETAALAGSGEGLEMLARLGELGVMISIDDYGTGLSTLDYLKKIPANEIKIDQSFVRGIADNRSDRLMVQSTISLAHSLGRKVVAEGVEQRQTLDLLIEMECDIAQGFAIGRPMSLENLAKRIATERKRSAA
jgi:EAL domain-containing protein (putative c-di-GMP-specific phosphodiesterase class I)/CHASE2 domain-containing sensor protein